MFNLKWFFYLHYSYRPIAYNLNDSLQCVMLSIIFFRKTYQLTLNIRVVPKSVTEFSFFFPNRRGLNLRVLRAVESQRGPRDSHFPFPCQNSNFFVSRWFFFLLLDRRFFNLDQWYTDGLISSSCFSQYMLFFTFFYWKEDFLVIGECPVMSGFTIDSPCSSTCSTRREKRMLRQAGGRRKNFAERKIQNNGL